MVGSNRNIGDKNTSISTISELRKKTVSVSPKSSNKNSPRIEMIRDVLWFRRLRVLLFPIDHTYPTGEDLIGESTWQIQVCSHYPHACYKRICPSCNQWDGGWVSSWKPNSMKVRVTRNYDDVLWFSNSPTLGCFIESEHFVELGRWSCTGSKRNCKVTVKSNHIFLERFDWWTLCHTDFDDKPHQFSQRKYADCVCVCADWFSGITDTICWGFPEGTRKTVNLIQSRCFGKINYTPKI